LKTEEGLSGYKHFGSALIWRR